MNCELNSHLNLLVNSSCCVLQVFAKDLEKMFGKDGAKLPGLSYKVQTETLLTLLVRLALNTIKCQIVYTFLGGRSLPWVPEGCMIE